MLSDPPRVAALGRFGFKRLREDAYMAAEVLIMGQIAAKNR